MSMSHTCGFDIVVEVSEQELNRHLEVAAASGTLPEEIISPFDWNGVRGEFHVLLGTPTLNFDSSSPNGVNIVVPFDHSAILINEPEPEPAIEPLKGQVEIRDRVTVVAEGNRQRVEVNFASGVEDVQVEVEGEGPLAQLLESLGMDGNAFQQQLEGQFRTILRDEVERLPLSMDIPVGGENDLLLELGARTINETGALDRDCLAYLISTDAATSGNPEALSHSIIPEGQGAVVMLSNDFVLWQCLCPELARQLGLGQGAFERPCKLSGSRDVVLDGESVTLQALEANIVGGTIVVTGTALMSGDGWHATATFLIQLELAMVDNVITVRLAAMPVVNVGVTMEPWVWILAVTVGRFEGLIVTAIVDSVLEGVIRGMITGLISGGVGDIPAIDLPLGPQGSGLVIEDIVLDDLMLIGSLKLVELFPIKSQGIQVMGPNHAVDLDRGEIQPVDTGQGDPLPANADLYWSEAPGHSVLSAVNGAKIALLAGTAFDSLTLLDLERATYTTNPIPLSFNPAAPPWRVTFAVRTNEVRYTKCSMSVFHTELSVEYVTYDVPTPSIELLSEWDVAAEASVGQSTEIVAQFEMPAEGGVLREPFDSISSRWVTYEASELAWHGRMEVKPRLLAFPIAYHWSLDGQVLGDQGTCVIDGREVTFEAERRFFEVWTEQGADLDAELCVRAVDAKGIELLAYIQLQRAGIKKKSVRLSAPAKLPPIRLWA